jgi:hypothetical protein
MLLLDRRMEVFIININSIEALGFDNCTQLGDYRCLLAKAEVPAVVLVTRPRATLNVNIKDTETRTHQKYKKEHYNRFSK